MILDSFFTQLSPLIDGERAMAVTEAIYRNDRWFDFSHFEKTARYVAEALEHAGATEVELLPLKADGVTRYGDWVIPRAWDAHSATLSVEGMGEEGLLADYQREPCCLSMYSAPARVSSAPVVIIDDPAEFAPRDLTGALILTGRPASALVPIARKHGAAGLVSDFFVPYPGVRAREDSPDAYRWDNDFVVPVNDTGLFAFNLSPRRGEQLRALCARQGGAPRLNASVETTLYDGVCYTVSGLIEGADPTREVMIVGHLYEPGANDNATGCAGIIELTAALAKLKPGCSVRVVMGFECAGQMGYSVHHPERLARVEMALNLDMIGAADADRAIMKLWHNPLCGYNYLDTLLPLADEAYRSFFGEDYPSAAERYSIADNLWADPTLGIPSVSMIMHPARSYHSSLDTMRMVSAQTLRRNIIIAGSVALAAAEDTAWLAPYIRNDIEKVCASSAVQPPSRALLERWAYESALARLETRPISALPDAFAAPFPRPEAAWIPRRLCLGPATLLCGTSADEPPRFRAYYSYGLNAPLYWMDGVRNLGEVARLTACELEKDHEAMLEHLLEYVSLLEEKGLLGIVRA